MPLRIVAEPSRAEAAGRSPIFRASNTGSSEFKIRLGLGLGLGLGLER
ncbi:MAG TPA: hypothetical protein VGO00_26125 [Kofleriaceae bacterium]|nr:hypothetical protein [Kofleriaceae bacterium]